MTPTPNNNPADKVRCLASERGLTSLMNDTKWREVCEAFRHWPGGPPRYRVRDVLAPEGYVSDWDREWYHHPRPYVSIHWLEVELPADARPSGADPLQTDRRPGGSHRHGRPRLGLGRPSDGPVFAGMPLHPWGSYA